MRTGILLLLSLRLAQVLIAQEADSLVELLGSEVTLDRLEPSSTSGNAVFMVDTCGTIRVQLTATRDDLTSSIETPGGQIVDESNVGNFGGTFVCFDGGSPGDAPAFPPLTQPGHHYIYSFASQGAGTYIVHFSVDSGLTEEVAVASELTTDSPVRIALFSTDSQVAVGEPVVLTAAVFEDTLAIDGAAVSAAVKAVDAGDPRILLNLLDDGVDADSAVGDGLYSGYFVTASQGRHYAVVEITGTRGDGTSFRRTAATTFDVAVGGASLTANPLADVGVDENANGFIDRIEISADISVDTAGEYMLGVFLQTAGGTILFGNGMTQLLTGSQTLTAVFYADQFLRAGDDGPFLIQSAELQRIDDTLGRVTIGRRTFAPPQQTQAYVLTQFERPPIVVTGALSDSGIDDDANGDFDRLRALVGVKVRAPGTYEWTAELADGCGRRIAFTRGQQTLAANVDEDVLIDFDGPTIGGHGIAGPYKVRNLTIYHVEGIFGDNSLIRLTVGDTQAYLASDFEGFTSAAGDCNANGQPDDCECLGDFDGDGQITIADYAIILAAFGTCIGDANYNAVADLDANGCVELADLTCFLARFGSTCP